MCIYMHVCLSFMRQRVLIMFSNKSLSVWLHVTLRTFSAIPDCLVTLLGSTQT